MFRIFKTVFHNSYKKMLYSFEPSVGGKNHAYDLLNTGRNLNHSDELHEKSLRDPVVRTEVMGLVERNTI